MHRSLKIFAFAVLGGFGLVGAFGPFGAFGQGGAAAIRLHIDNKNTPAHIRIAGSRLFLVPPPHFTRASWYSGVERGDQAGIVVIDLKGGSFYANAATFSKAELERRGVRVLDYRQLTVGGYPAKFALIQAPGASQVYELVFGDSTFSAIVTATNKTGDAATSAALLGSLNSIVYDKKARVDPFEMAHFTFGSNSSAFQFFRSSGNMFIYSPGGADHSHDADAPVMIVTQAPLQGGLTLKTLVGQILQQEARNGMSSPALVRESDRKYNGLDAYEAEYNMSINGVMARLYYFATAKGTMAVVINGVARKQADKNVAEFKKLAYSIRMK